MRQFLGKKYRSLRGWLHSKYYNVKHKSAQFDLLILDDFFPNPVSGFRFTEFNQYFIEFKTVCLTTGGAMTLVNEKKSVRYFLNTYKKAFPMRTATLFDSKKEPLSKVCYTVFLNNAYQFLPYIEAHQLDFVFCLYPGGGFNLNEEETDKKLSTITQSPYFQGVIVTQKNSYNYLLNKKFCSEDKICHIFGGIIPINQYPKTENRAYYGFQKPTLDICFMANKYMAGGIDKGFDVFTGVAKHFSAVKNIRFHVIGSFSKDDVSDFDAQNITFHGAKLTAELNPFFDAIDIILSPNRASVLNKGAFDGFPTGSCVEASLKGVAMFVTDPLELNTVYQNGENIEIIEPSVDTISEKIAYYFEAPDALRELATKGQTRTRFLFSNEIQLNKRVAFLREKLRPLSIK
jgi:hypothetical protein